MEPFLTSDGRLLFFNNRNAAPTDTNIYYAQRIDDTHFKFLGEVKGVNSLALDAVPSMDAYGQFYFVSTRDYAQTLSTLFTGDFHEGGVTNVSHVSNVSAMKLGHVNFDAEISPDGQTLYYVDGIFSGGAIPDQSSIQIAHPNARGGFSPDTESVRIMSRVNEGTRQYAPASRDATEIFFTRLDKFFLSPKPAIYSASRPDARVPFETIKRIDAIQGFAEAPTLSPDGCALYYHALNNGHYSLWRVTRQPH